MLTTAPPPDRPSKIRVNISIETATEAAIVAAAEASAEPLAHGERSHASAHHGAEASAEPLAHGERPMSTGCLGFLPKGAVPGDQFLHITICNQNRAGVAPLTPTQVRGWTVIASECA
jgi:hypothetical protein